LMAGGLKPLQTISIVAAFPFIFIMVMTAISTIKALKNDEKVQK
ncbi:MAG: BCCT family transporter, partial [Lachnospiraceae bacterium]|nr:BCCT family transporter [Lachnospiraceae bacterium]